MLCGGRQSARDEHRRTRPGSRPKHAHRDPHRHSGSIDEHRHNSRRKLDNRQSRWRRWHHNNDNRWLNPHRLASKGPIFGTKSPGNRTFCSLELAYGAFLLIKSELSGALGSRKTNIQAVGIGAGSWLGRASLLFPCLKSVPNLGYGPTERCLQKHEESLNCDSRSGHHGLRYRLRQRRHQRHG
jgi:hypothetical protein